MRKEDADPLFDVAGRVVVVTGGMGRLGRQYSLALASRGARVAVIDLDVSANLRLERFEEWADASEIKFIEANITSRGSLEEALREVENDWGAPHALVNNAAIDSPPDAPAELNGLFESFPERAFDEVMDVNVKGVLLSCQVFGGRMAEAGRGSIINISSIYGMLSPNQSLYEYRRTEGDTFFKPVAYSISKSALFNLTRYLATYWAEKGVRVNTLTLAGVFDNQDPRFLAGYTRQVPLGRMARPDEYSGAVVFLISDASSYMTGSNMIVDGGWSAW